jgi:hypothetical protein
VHVLQAVDTPGYNFAALLVAVKAAEKGIVMQCIEIVAPLLTHDAPQTSPFWLLNVYALLGALYWHQFDWAHACVAYESAWAQLQKLVPEDIMRKPGAIVRQLEGWESGLQAIACNVLAALPVALKRSLRPVDAIAAFRRAFLGRWRVSAILLEDAVQVRLSFAFACPTVFLVLPLHMILHCSCARRYALST